MAEPIPRKIGPMIFSKVQMAATPITQTVNYNLAAIQPLVSTADFAQLQTIHEWHFDVCDQHIGLGSA